MTEGPIIRRVGDADFEAYQSLMLAGVRAHPDRFRLTEDDVLAELPPIGDDEGGYTLGAFDEGNLVGVISVTREKREKLRHKALLSRMYVLESHTGRGIGRQLVAEAVRLAPTLSVRHVNLTVISGNAAARKVYADAGFVTYAKEPGSVHSLGQDRDEEQMKLVLPA